MTVSLTHQSDYAHLYFIDTISFLQLIYLLLMLVPIGIGGLPMNLPGNPMNSQHQAIYDAHMMQQQQQQQQQSSHTRKLSSNGTANVQQPNVRGGKGPKRKISELSATNQGILLELLMIQGRVRKSLFQIIS